MGDDFKDIDPDIHQKMQTYTQKMNEYKEIMEKLIFIASDPLKSDYLAKAKKLVNEMKAEHENFKNYLRDRGWLEKDASTKAPVSNLIQSRVDIASTSGS
jgi:uncharacterized coiled-coil DUF342 family protein